MVFDSAATSVVDLLIADGVAAGADDGNDLQVLADAAAINVNGMLI